MQTFFAVLMVLAMFVGPIAFLVWIGLQIPAIGNGKPETKAKAKLILLGCLGLFLVSCTGGVIATGLSQHQAEAERERRIQERQASSPQQKQKSLYEQALARGANGGFLAAIKDLRRIPQGDPDYLKAKEKIAEYEAKAAQSKRSAEAKADADKKAEVKKPQEAVKLDVPYLGELNASDIYLNLTKQPYSFKRENTEYHDDGMARHTVSRFDSDTGADLAVDIYTFGAARVVKVLAKVTGGGSLAAAGWLFPYAATAPIDGIDAQDAKDWVTANWSKAKEGQDLSREFGPATFTLKARKGWRSLVIEGKGYDAWQEGL